VVGFGNSGAEIALDMWEHDANVTILARSPTHVLPRWLANLPLLGARPFYLARHLTPLWLSDMLNRKIVMPLLMADLEAHGLRLRWDQGIKTAIFREHRPPMLDIGTLGLIRRGEVRVISAPISSLSRDGATFTDGSSARFDAIVLATGFDKLGAPHSHILPAELLPHLPSPWGFVESGASPAAPGLFFSGFTDHSGRLAEIHEESADIARQIAAEHVRPFDRARRRAELLAVGGGLAHQANGLLQACVHSRVHSELRGPRPSTVINSVHIASVSRVRLRGGCVL
jgi:indole-3-pyruvate monooxygenase